MDRLASFKDSLMQTDVQCTQRLQAQFPRCVQAAGQLCETLQWSGEVPVGLQGVAEDVRASIGRGCAVLFSQLIMLAVGCGIDLAASIEAKVSLNERKYPPSIVRGKSGKYTTYSGQTGYHKTGQSIGCRRIEPTAGWRTDVGIEQLTLRLREFAIEREWEQFHAPRNLLLALMGEIGELAELFVTLDASKPRRWSVEALDMVAQELADTCIYTIRFADVCGLSLSQELTRYISKLNTLSCSIKQSDRDFCPSDRLPKMAGLWLVGLSTLLPFVLWFIH